MKVNNQWQEAIYYLIKWDKFSLKDVINDSMFYKFQTRLGEIEAEHGTLVERGKQSFTTKHNKSRKYTTYKAIDKEKLKEIFKLYE
jgi:hypothetical protein